MSRAGVDEAVDRIRGDRELAGAVVEDGADALSSFDLTDDERAAIVDALRLDVEEATSEVSGFAFGGFEMAMPLNNLIGVGRSLGGGGVTRPGGAQWVDPNQQWVEMQGNTEF
ncbi:MAG TPA: hypothetical protein VEI83_08100 [Acidimicrobiales bacterium]|nr:hypothetical protein [Acidimicrobiales bacterium]